MIKILRDCFGSRYLKWLAVGAILVALGLLAWGVAPKLIISALPLLGIAACLLPCLLPFYWLRRSSPSPATPTPPQGDDHPISR
jgi:hypothetical protein